MANSITWAELKKAERSLKKVAVQQGVSLEEVRESIKEAISAVSFGGKALTPEEFVAWCAREVSQRIEH